MLANAFETSRTDSMKRLTTGLNVRFFNVKAAEEFEVPDTLRNRIEVAIDD